MSVFFILEDISLRHSSHMFLKKNILPGIVSNKNSNFYCSACFIKLKKDVLVMKKKDSC